MTNYNKGEFLSSSGCFWFFAPAGNHCTLLLRGTFFSYVNEKQAVIERPPQRRRAHNKSFGWQVGQKWLERWATIIL